MSKMKPSKKAVNGVTKSISKAVVLVLVLSMIMASGAASYSKAPAAAEGGGVQTTMSVSATAGQANIYVTSGGQLHKLSPDNGGSIWSRWTQATEEIEVTKDGDAIIGNGSIITRYDSDGTQEWVTAENGPMGDMDIMDGELLVLPGDDTDLKRFNTSSGSKTGQHYMAYWNGENVEGFGGKWMTIERNNFIIRYPFDLSGFEVIKNDGADHAMGDTRDYLWIERDAGVVQPFGTGGTSVGSNVSLQYNPDELAGYGTNLFGASNGSVYKWDVLDGPSLNRKWKSDIYGDNDTMHIAVDEGKGHILIANNYDVALLDENGNLIWSRTFSSPVGAIGISNSEPVTYSISGQVIDANNNPLENASVEVQTAFQTIASGQTNSTGHYKISGLDPGTYDIAAWKSGYERVTKTRDLDRDIVLDFLLQTADTNTLEGNVDDAYGNPIENATVRVLNNGNVVGAAKTDGVGFYSISGIPNGTYEVEAFKQGYQSTSLTLTINNYTTQDLILRKGENLVRGYVSNTEGDPLSGVIVWVGSNGSTVTSISTESDGYYEVLIDDGNYTFIYSKTGYQEVRISRNITSNRWLNVTMGNLSLIIEAPSYMSHGSDAQYQVFVDNGSDRWEVTGDPNLTLSSSNYNVVGIDTVNFLLTATSNTSINQEVTIRGNYNYSADVNLYDSHQVTVSNTTVAQLPILPPWWRINAVMNDDTIFALIIMIWTAVVGARWTTSFGGLGAGGLAGIIFWYAGYLSVGMMLLAAFVALFLGMNVASNIEYSVRQ